MAVHCACGLEAVIRTSWTNQNPCRLLRSRNELEEILAMVEEKRCKLLKFLIINWVMGYVAECGFVLVDGMNIFDELMQTQREAQQANELSNLTRQRQLLVSVNYRLAIIEELKHLPGNLVAYKTREHLKHIQKAVLVEVIELKKELRLQVPP
ncbi:hypothetical protein Tco_0656584 [Tanacetum coccineum]|uniref:Uncharacterized protein n=1 Tax=Tanacetum coccineum TaxID=301880 RepID=A0ABQ4X966_9ASTR